MRGYTVTAFGQRERWDLKSCFSVHFTFFFFEFLSLSVDFYPKLLPIRLKHTLSTDNMVKVVFHHAYYKINLILSRSELFGFGLMVERNAEKQHENTEILLALSFTIQTR